MLLLVLLPLLDRRLDYGAVNSDPALGVILLLRAGVEQEGSLASHRPSALWQLILLIQVGRHFFFSAAS